MRMDRVADFDFGKSEPINVMHFVDLGSNINFLITIACIYPSSELAKVQDYEEIIDPKKLKPIKLVNMTTYDNREEFEDDRAGWMDEGEHAYGWANIKLDKISRYAVTAVAKKMIRDIFE